MKSSCYTNVPHVADWSRILPAHEGVISLLADLDGAIPVAKPKVFIDRPVEQISAALNGDLVLAGVASAYTAPLRFDLL